MIYPINNDNSLVHMMPPTMGNGVSNNPIALNQQGMPISNWQNSQSLVGVSGEHQNLNIPPNYASSNDAHLQIVN